MTETKIYELTALSGSTFRWNNQIVQRQQNGDLVVGFTVSGNELAEIQRLHPEVEICNNKMLHTTLLRNSGVVIAEAAAADSGIDKQKLNALSKALTEAFDDAKKAGKNPAAKDVAAQIDRVTQEPYTEALYKRFLSADKALMAKYEKVSPIFCFTK